MCLCRSKVFHSFFMRVYHVLFPGLLTDGRTCERGYYYDRNVTQNCLPCQKGSYKPTKGQGLCISCGQDEVGNNLTTRGTGQISIHACYAVSSNELIWHIFVKGNAGQCQKTPDDYCNLNGFSCFSASALNRLSWIVCPLCGLQHFSPSSSLYLVV